MGHRRDRPGVKGMHEESASSRHVPEQADGMTRRELLNVGAGGALLLGAGGLLGAGSAQSAVMRALAAPKRGGRLRVGIGGGGPTDNFDAALINGPSATTRGQVFYETLTWLDGRFKLHNWLADEVTPNARGDQWTVRLRSGLEFHNGKTVTADDVLFSIRRIMNPKSGATAAAQLNQLDLARSRKLDRRTVRFVLKKPYSFFDQVLSDIVYIIPLGYNPKQPVSTGPWKLISYAAGRQTVLEPFANYWGRKPYVDQLVLLEIPDDSARVNALLSGQVDVINQVPFGQLAVLKGNKSIKLVSSPTGAWNPITMRVDVAPFSDVRVRQAIRLCMDRKQAVASALLGQGAPAYDYYGRFDPCYAQTLKRGPDIERARSLLKAAGKSDLKVELVTTPLSAGIVEACQVLAQNAKAAGITISLRKVDVSTYFSQYGKWPFSIDYWVGLPYLVIASINDGPGANVVNTTHFNDPQFNRLFDRAAATLDEKKRCAIVHDMQRIQFERGGNIIWSFQNTVDAYTTKVAGYAPVDETGWGLGRCRLDRLYFV
jgi:peptide/nickel transport system substrate-binding protein